MKDVVWDARQKCLKEAEDAVQVEKEICDTFTREVLVATGTCAKPGEILAARIERTLVEAIKNATTAEEVTRLERYLDLGLLPASMMGMIENDQRIADEALVADME